MAEIIPRGWVQIQIRTGGGYPSTSLRALSYRLSDQGKRSRRYPRGIPRSLGYRSIPAVNGDGALLGILMVKKD